MPVDGARRVARRAGALLVLGWVLGCAGAQAPLVLIADDSAMLAVDVRFPVPLGRDPSLVNAYFVRGPIHGGLDPLPSLVPATVVKGERAYLLDPPPGTYSLVAVVHAYSPPRNRAPVSGVRDSVASAGEIGNTIIFDSVTIAATRTILAAGSFASMGTFEVHEGERIHAGTRFRDVLQERLADAVRPGATSADGLGARFARNWTLDAETSRMDRADAAERALVTAARSDLEGSPWTRLLPAVAEPPRDEWQRERRALAERERRAEENARREAARVPVAPPAVPEAGEPEATPTVAPPAPAPTVTPPVPAPSVTPSHLDPLADAVPEPPAPPEPAPVDPAPPAPAIPEPDPPSPVDVAVAVRPPAPSPEPSPTAPPPPRIAAGAGTFADLRPGMSHEEVRRLLGDPEHRTSYLKPKALIPFYSGPDTHGRVWHYRRFGRVVFSLNSHTGSLRVERLIGLGEEE